MFPSSILCRTQEAYHRERAASARLDNVRTLATNAAIAWGQEALVAERREARRIRTSRIASVTALRKPESREERDRLLSENPDRGFECT
jgi:hypothetical protein